MTVGVAALCQFGDASGDAVVWATDTQLSRGFTSSQTRKADPIGGRWAALISASELAHADDLFAELNDRFRPEPIDTGKAANEALTAARNALMQRKAANLLPPGFTLERFYADGRAILPDWAFRATWDSLQNFRLKFELLVVGMDANNQGHIFTVGAGEPTSHDREGFCAIGSGALIALSILSASDQEIWDPWKITAYQVFAAKES